MTSFSYPDFVDYRDRNDALDGLVCYTPRSMTLTHGGQAERIQGMVVSGNYFDVQGVRLALGRGFLPEEDKTRGTHPVTVLSSGLWRRRFGGDPRIVAGAPDGDEGRSGHRPRRTRAGSDWSGRRGGAWLAGSCSG